MRDPKRIPAILARLQAVWEQYPDLRLMQLIGNVLPDDPYYVEDGEALRRLEEFYKVL
jgi:uncharacterized protein YihD (DUF1040 family)